MKFALGGLLFVFGCSLGYIMGLRALWITMPVAFLCGIAADCLTDSKETK